MVTVAKSAGFCFGVSRAVDMVFAAVKEAGIYVRYFPGERTGNHLRITVGTREQTEALLAFLRKYLK